jgi:hypothetical protein
VYPPPHMHPPPRMYPPPHMYWRLLDSGGVLDACKQEP